MSDRTRSNGTDHAPQHGLGRRSFLQWAAAAGAAATLPGLDSSGGTATAAPASQLPGASVTAALPPLPALPMAKFPEKTDLILLTDRPPNLETPIRHFVHDLTPNDAFFVRWHLGIIPTRIDADAYRLKVGGHVGNELSLSLAELKKDFEPTSVVAVNQCSGNSRSFFAPRVPGGQWGNGAVGNAKWTGVRLADLLKKAGVKAGAVDVTFAGLDRSPMPTVQPFVKSLPVGSEKLGEAIVAYAMNDQPLPMLNGFPLRLVVPGWFATYWIKTLADITVTDEPFKGFWMAKAYRVPTNAGVQEAPTELAKDTVPIGPMTCRSIFVRPEPGERVPADKPFELNGLAWDSGKGIAKVEVSTDGGKSWTAAALDKDLGRYSWRRFRFAWTPGGKGEHVVLARATNAAGETQQSSQWNRSGYAWNVIEKVTVTAV